MIRVDSGPGTMAALALTEPPGWWGRPLARRERDRETRPGPGERDAFFAASAGRPTSPDPPHENGVRDAGDVDPPRPILTNGEMADRLDEVAELLDARHANPFRVQAYRAGATTLRALEKPAREVYAEGGARGLMQLPRIGRSLARSICRMIETGRLPLLARLRTRVPRWRTLTTVPGIGKGLAQRIHEELGIESLRELMAAAADGRLARLSGFGRKRLRAVRESLAGRFQSRTAPTLRAPRADGAPAPPVAELLDVDAEYRRRAAAGSLPRIAPRRFNPSGEAWLPVLRTRRDDRRYTALFSNTANAHRFGRTGDWVIIHRDDDDQQWTVLTERHGHLAGRRVIRGRESECAAHHARQPAPPIRPTQKVLSFEEPAVPRHEGRGGERG